MRSITSHASSAPEWFSLLQWAGSILSMPKRAGKKHNVASCVMKRIGSPSPVQAPLSGLASRHDSFKGAPSLARLVAAKLEDGNLKAAIRLVISEDTFSSPSQAGLVKLQEKHLPSCVV